MKDLKITLMKVFSKPPTISSVFIRFFLFSAFIFIHSLPLPSNAGSIIIH